MKRFSPYVSLALSVAALLLAAADAPAKKEAHGWKPTGSSVAKRFAAADPASGAMFRWWWPNAAVEADQLVAQLDEVAAAGYAGVEIASVLGLGPIFPGSIGYPVDPDVYGYGTERWNGAVETALKAAHQRGLQVDLTLGAHWPPSVPGLDVDGPASTKELAYGYGLVEEGASYSGPIPRPAPRSYTDRTSQNGVMTTAVRTAEPTLIRVLAVRCTADCGGTPRLQLDSVTDLTGQLDGETLEWAPTASGPWVVVSFWRRGTGIRNDLPLGPLASLYTDPEARAIDYFSSAGTEAFTDYFESLLSPQTRQLMRQVGGAVFEDSIEIGVGAAHVWTSRFLEQFERRRGYSLVPFLPILAANPRSGFGGTPQPAFSFESEDQETIQRVKRDVDQTYSDLYIDEHVRPMARWTDSLGLEYRAQPYGEPVDIGQAATLVDVPECESFACGLSNDWRLMTSAADLAGKRIVSDEMIPGVTLSPRPGPYAQTQAEIIRQVNAQYAAGANRIVFHGLPYPHWPPAADGSKADGHTGWPGFHPFAGVFAEAFGPRQPEWTMASDASGYLNRTQLILQTGTRRTDLAFFDQTLGHIAGAPAQVGSVAGAGYSYGYVTPATLALPATRVEGGRLGPEGPRFRALIVAEEPTMDLGAAKRIDQLAAAGLPVVFAGARPSAVPGYAASAEIAAEQDRQLRQIVATTLGRDSVRAVGSSAELPALLRSIGIAPRVRSSVPLQSVSRHDRGVSYHYLFNGSANAVDARVRLDRPGRTAPYLLDAWTGTITPLRDRGRGKEASVDVALAPRGAAIVALAPSGWGRGLGGSGRRQPSGESASLPPAIPLLRWDLVVDEWLPALPGQPSSAMNHSTVRVDDLALAPWSNVPALSDAAGIGTYSTAATLPARSRAAGWQLDLGRVEGSFRVRVNGRSAGVVDQLLPRVDVSSLLRPGKNRIEVTVATTLINRVRTAQPHFAGVPKQETGLLGPARLVPYASGS